MITTCEDRNLDLQMLWCTNGYEENIHVRIWPRLHHLWD